MDAVGTLRSCSLFKDFTDTGLQIVAGISTERVFPRGTPLFVENMIADSLLIVGEGKVRVSSRTLKGDEVALGEMGPGDYLGELSLLQQGQRMCTATALSSIHALELRHVDFQKLLAQKPQACLKLLMGIVTQFGQKVNDNRDALKSLLSRT
jgi:CRP-like cAMP-binding protein